MEEGGMRGVLKFATFFQILSLKIVIFCGCQKYMTPKWFKITTNSINSSSNFLFNIKQARYILTA